MTKTIRERIESTHGHNDSDRLVELARAWDKGDLVPKDEVTRNKFITPEQQAAYLIAQTAVLNATIAGMVAENMQRKALGQSMAYVEDAFQDFINDSRCQHDAIMAFFEGR